MSRERLRNVYGGTKVLSAKQYEAMIKLLSIFAEHISVVSNQIVVHRENAESPVIKRAKEFIVENQAEDLSLGQVAKAVNTSTFHFCKMFKKATGLNFTEYVSRVRVEKARNLLLNPNLRISEIAYEVGFQSLTHFNRVFKKITGQSPDRKSTRLNSSHSRHDALPICPESFAQSEFAHQRNRLRSGFSIPDPFQSRL